MSAIARSALDLDTSPRLGVIITHSPSLDHLPLEQTPDRSNKAPPLAIIIPKFLGIMAREQRICANHPHPRYIFRNRLS